MRTIISCLAVLAPLVASAQSPSSQPTRGPAAELELIYLLVQGKIDTQTPGSSTMRVQISEGSAASGVTGTLEISKTGQCRYEVARDFVTRMPNDETLFYKDKASYDFSKSVTALIKTAESGGYVVTFDGPKGTVSLVKDLYFVRKGVREDEAKQIETEEDWDLDLNPSEGNVDAAAYIAAGKDFASRFCPAFQAPSQ